MEIVLIHAPLVGPFTWELVAGELEASGIRTAVPILHSRPGLNKPFWEQYAQAVAEACVGIPSDQAIILVGHSGAGPMLPAMRTQLGCAVAGYIFVDSGLPENGRSLFDLFESPEEVEAFRGSAQNGLLPVWTDDDLREIIPDKTVRARFIKELHPLPVQVYEEPLPVFDGWPDALCGYLRFGDNPAYEAASQRARKAEFAYVQIQGEHFHMLVEPGIVARALVELVKRIGIWIP